MTVSGFPAPVVVPEADPNAGGQRIAAGAVPMRVVFINRFYRPDHSATSQMLTQLAEHLATRGVRTVVVTGRGGYESERFSARHELLDGVEVYRVGSSVVTRHNLVLRAAQVPLLWFAIWLKLLGILERRDIVVALTDPPLAGIVGWLAARVRGARIVHWLQDVFPEVAIGALPAPARRVAATSLPIRDAVLARSAAIVVIGERMRDYVRTHAARTPIALIPNWADDTDLVPLSGPMEQRPEGMEAVRLIVGYQGNLGRVHDASTILEAATRLSTRADIHFRFTGGGVGMASFREEVRIRELQNVSFWPYVEPGLLNESLSIPDLHLISLRSQMEGYVVPSKLYSALSVGRGVVFVGDADGEVARLLRDAEAGVQIAPNASEALADLLVELAADPARVRTWGANAREFIERRASRASSFELWHSTLAALPRD